MTTRIREFLRNRRDDGRDDAPCLVVDLDIVRENYHAFAKALPDTRVFYAVKANPAPEVLRLLAGLGSCFDTASVAEIEMVLAAGATPDRVSYGNTIKKERDIARALASLGHRFDGQGGWVDERLPTQRELTLALGYAGFDAMRVRQWPNEHETAELFRDVEVAADEYLAGVAGDLTLAEMVDMLGRRADGLVELWNHWGRIRLLLLEEA